jgi:preprotein translocase subunit SecE
MNDVREKVSKGVQFLKEVKVELKRISWPSREETVKATGVVLITVIIFSLFLGIVDLGLQKIITFILG